MKRIRVAIVGCGKVAVYHARHLQSFPQIEICGVVDTDLAAAQKFAGHFSIPLVCGNLKEAFEKARPEAVHIITPPASHEALCEESLRSGAHVLIEKPVAYSLAGMQRLYELSAEKNLLLTPDFSLFYLPGMNQARDWIMQGRIGKVTGVECLYHTKLDPGQLQEAVEPPWPYELPAGVLHNFFTHPLYLVLPLVGEVKSLQIIPRHLGYLPQKLTDSLDLLIEGSGCTGFINVSVASGPPCISLVVHGERGRITVDLASFQVSLTRSPSRAQSLFRLLHPAVEGLNAIKQTMRNGIAIARQKLVQYGGLRALIERYYSAIANQTGNPISPALVLAICQVEEQIIRAPGCWRLTYPQATVEVPPLTRPKCVAVTGASGKLGTRVVGRLLQEGYIVRALVRWQSQIEHLVRPGVELVYGDVRELDSVRRLVAGTEGVIHLAAGMKGSRQYMLDTCAEGTRNVIQAAAEAKLARNLHVSSMVVFDYLALHSNDVLRVNSPLEPEPKERSAYAESKLDAELSVAEEQRNGGSPWLILRPSAIFDGSGSAAQHAGFFVGSRLLLFGGPRRILRLIHVDDVASAICFFFDPINYRPGLVLNLTHPDTMRNRDMAALLRQGGAKVYYLRRVVGIGLGATTRLVHNLLKRGPQISRRQAAYLFSECGADASSCVELGWRPLTRLPEQLAESSK